MLALTSCLLGLGQLSVAYAQDSAAVFQRHYRVGHFTRVLNVPGTLGENRPVNVHLWYPSLSSEDCQNSGTPDANSGSSDADSGNSDANGEDKGCSSVYTSRLFGTPLLPQWDPLSWTIGSTMSFENLPISGERSFPVIIFSHGNGNNVIDHVYMLEALASFGFIVAAPDHLNDTQDDVRIDFINSQAGFELIPCFDGLPSPCDRAAVRKSLTDRVHDVSAVIDALPFWFGDRADTSRVGVMGHSRGTVTALAAAGGSPLMAWNFPPEPRVKAIMGLAIGTHDITFGVDLQNVKVPALLVDGTLDQFFQVSKDAFAALTALTSTEKAFVVIENAKHRHFDSALCAETQSSGAIAAANPRAILDLLTIRTVVVLNPNNGLAMDLCGYDTFSSPTDITSLVKSLTAAAAAPPGGFVVTPTNVPTTGLTSDQVKDQVVRLAASFFSKALQPQQSQQ
jgi:predicted dienelactone hydrolase